MPPHVPETRIPGSIASWTGRAGASCVVPPVKEGSLSTTVGCYSAPRGLSLRWSSSTTSAFTFKPPISPKHTLAWSADASPPRIRRRR